MNVIPFPVFLIVLAPAVYATGADRRYKLLVDGISLSNNTYQTEVWAKSKIGCATLCSQNSKCYSFTFDKVTKTCTMSSALVQPASGSLYYDSRCPYTAGYTYVQHLNLCFRMKGGDEYTPPQTKAICESEGAHLVLIKNNETQQFLVDEIYREGLDADTIFFYIDGTDKEVEDVWKSYDGILMDFFGWNIIEPQGGTNENCILLFKTHNYQWADASCNATSTGGGYICQIDIL